MSDNFKITDAQVQQIIDTPRTLIEGSDVFNDIILPKKERIEHARKILDYRKDIIREAMSPPSDATKQRNKDAYELLRKLQGNKEE